LTIRQFEAADLPFMQQVRQAAFKPVFESFRNIVGEQIFLIALAEFRLTAGGTTGKPMQSRLV
jgi:hypothetical protein